MKSTDGFERGQSVTTGEKVLIVMLIAGVFGYWAGFKVSTPGDLVGMPVATAASLWVAPPAAAAKASAEKNVRVGAAPKDVVPGAAPGKKF